MTNDEILQAAKEIGLTGLSLIDVGYLERFAAIIEKRTIERCEAACNSLIKSKEGIRRLMELDTSFMTLKTAPQLSANWENRNEREQAHAGAVAR